MAEGDSPTIARRRVRIAIREAREAVALTQAQVAEHMEWGHSKVIRIENGDVTITVKDLRGLLSLLGVRDRIVVESLLADARIARNRQRAASAWWQDSLFRDQLSDSLRKFFEYEAEAVELRSFNIIYVPGPLQTPEYATALTRPWAEEGFLFTPQKVDALVEARLRRRESLLRRIPRVKYLVLLDQSVLMRSIGGLSVFAGQLTQLIELSGCGLVTLRMLPFDLPIPMANNGSFELLTVGPDPWDSDILYRENGVHDEMVENRNETARHRKRFDQLWRVACDEGETIAFIQSRLGHLGGAAPENQA